MTTDFIAPSEDPQSEPKRLTISSLFPAKTPVETSIGTLYVRKVNVDDLKALENNEIQDLGKKAVGLLSSRIEDKNIVEHLNGEDLEALNVADLQALAPVIAKQNGWGEMSPGTGLVELGHIIMTAKNKRLEDHKLRMEELRKSIGSSYSFLGSSSLEKLQEQMAGISNIRNNLLDTGALGTAARLAELANIGLNSRSKVFEESASLSKPFEAFKPIQIPRFEDSPLGRATFEGVKNSRETAQKMNDLVEVVAGLNQTLIKEVLPAWFNQVDEGQKGAEIAIKQAATSLKWTKRAVYLSVVVTVLATWVQVAVSLDLDSDNSEQQNRTEGILLKQLAGQQQFFEQQDRKEKLLITQLEGQQQLIQQQDRNEKMLIKQLRDQKSLMEQQMRDAAAMRKEIATLQSSRPSAALEEKPRL